MLYKRAHICRHRCTCAYLCYKYFQLFKYHSLYFKTIYGIYIGIITKYLMAENVVTATYITFYIFLVIYLFFGTYLPTQVSGVLRVVRKQTVLVVCAPLGVQFYYIVFVFLHSFHQGRDV
ncbi:p360 9L 1 [African swine fever virus]|uniref:p360 9L 1 n=1 Tax=African swine fever virus TaxID=10497 RepID=A0A894KT64_ASF|nr:p360 9L 1 [African swine fever virus]